MSLALFGLALAVPTAAMAQGPAQPGAPGGPHRHTKGLFGNKRSCTECQVKELAAKGIHVPPPPPPIPDGAIVTEGECTACESAPMVSGPMTFQGGGAPATRSSTGGLGLCGGRGRGPFGEPTPIGMVNPGLASSVPPAAAAGRPGTMDRSLTPTSMAPNPIRPKTHNDPRVLSHLFGLSDLRPGSACGPGGQGARGARQISYGPVNGQVNEVPASVIYGAPLISTRPRPDGTRAGPSPRGDSPGPFHAPWVWLQMEAPRGRWTLTKAKGITPRWAAGDSPPSPGPRSRLPQDAGMVRAQESTARPPLARIRTLQEVSTERR